MTTRPDDAKVEFRVARADRADDVLSVLDEAAAWLHEQGITQWPARLWQVHRMAVRRQERGLGVVIRAWAANIACQHTTLCAWTA